MARWELSDRNSQRRPTSSNQPSSVHDLDAEFRGLLELRARAGARHDDVGLLRDGARDLGAEPLGHGLGLLARHLLERAGEHHRLARDRGLAIATASSGSGVTCSSRASSISSLCGSPKKSTSASATTSPMPPMAVSSASASDSWSRGRHGAVSRRASKVAEMAGEQACRSSRRHARMPSAKMKRSSAMLRRASMAANRFAALVLAPAFAVLEPLSAARRRRGLQREDVLRARDQARPRRTPRSAARRAPRCRRRCGRRNASAAPPPGPGRQPARAAAHRRPPCRCAG